MVVDFLCLLNLNLASEFNKKRKKDIMNWNRKCSDKWQMNKMTCLTT